MGVPHRQSLIRFPIADTGFPEAIDYSDTSLPQFQAAGSRRPRLRPALCFVTRGGRDACWSQLMADIKRTVTQRRMLELVQVVGCHSRELRPLEPLRHGNPHAPLDGGMDPCSLLRVCRMLMAKVSGQRGQEQCPSSCLGGRGP